MDSNGCVAWVSPLVRMSACHVGRVWEPGTGNQHKIAMCKKKHGGFPARKMEDPQVRWMVFVNGKIPSINGG